MRQRALDAGVFVIFPILLLGLASRAADDGSAVVENQDVARVAPVCRSAPTDVGDDFAGDALVRPEDEDAFGMRRGELAAAGSKSPPDTAPASAAATARPGELHPPGSVGPDAARDGFWPDRRK